MQTDAGGAVVDDAGPSPNTPNTPTLPGADRDASAATRDGAAPDRDAEVDPPPVTGGPACLMGTSADYRADGPYQTASEDVNLGGTLGSYTIFYPTQMSDGCHPVVGWGNGTGVTGSGVYAHFSEHAASWGVITIAAHNSNAGSQPFIAGGIDYMLEQNAASGSKFFGKLNQRAGSAGHSQGGFAALTAASHPNIKAIVNVQGGGRAPASAAMICLTGVEDFVRSQCTSSFNSAQGPAFLADHTSADHINTPTLLGASTPAGKEYIRMYTSWFRCFLGDDQAACALYRGSAPPVCQGGDWANCKGKAIP
jgi:hypothetical protein